MATNLTSKWRVTVPKAVHDYLGLEPRVAVTFERLTSGEVVVRAANRRGALRAGAIAKLRERATVRMSTEEIMVLTRGSRDDDSR